MEVFLVAVVCTWVDRTGVLTRLVDIGRDRNVRPAKPKRRSPVVRPNVDANLPKGRLRRMQGRIAPAEGLAVAIRRDLLSERPLQFALGHPRPARNIPPLRLRIKFRTRPLGRAA